MTVAHPEQQQAVEQSDHSEQASQPQDVSPQEALQEQISEFIQACQTPLNQPIVASNSYKRRAPIKQTARPAGPATLLRRSKRLAIKEKTMPRHTVKRAQRVIMQKLGLIEQDKVPTAEDCTAFDELFSQPLSKRHIIALADLFSKGANSAALQSQVLADQGQLDQA